MIRIKEKINIKRKIQYFLLILLNIKRLKSCGLFFTLLIPYGVPHELHTNLPDNERSALKLELPQIKHLFAFIIFESIQIII